MKGVWLVLCGIAVLSVPLGLYLARQPHGIPLLQWAYGVGPVLLGFAVGLAAIARVSPLVLVGLAALGVSVMAVQPGWTGVPTAWFLVSASGILFGALLATLALVYPTQGSAQTTFMGELAMPIYLLHPLFLSVMAKLFDAGPAIGATAAIIASGLVGVAMLASARLRALM